MAVKLTEAQMRALEAIRKYGDLTIWHDATGMIHSAGIYTGGYRSITVIRTTAARLLSLGLVAPERAEKWWEDGHGYAQHYKLTDYGEAVLGPPPPERRYPHISIAPVAVGKLGD